MIYDLAHFGLVVGPDDIESDLSDPTSHTDDGHLLVDFCEHGGFDHRAEEGQRLAATGDQRLRRRLDWR